MFALVLAAGGRDKFKRGILPNPNDLSIISEALRPEAAFSKDDADLFKDSGQDPGGWETCGAHVSMPC